MRCKTLNRSLLKIFQSFKSKLSNFIIKKNFKFKIQINLLQKGGDVLFDLHSFSTEEVFYIDELLNFLISINVIESALNKIVIYQYFLLTMNIKMIWVN